MKKLLVLSVLALTMVLASSSEAKADDTPCVGSLTGTFDNIVVPPRATCTLTNSTVRGNVKALEGSRLLLLNDTVHGNVQGDKANSVQVAFCTIGGNVEIIEAGDPVLFSAVVRLSVLTGGNITIEKGRFPLGDWIVESNDVLNGTIKVEENGSMFLNNISDNIVAQNLQVFKNFGPGRKSVVFNYVGENLQCKENTPVFLSAGNMAGQTEDQCGP